MIKIIITEVINDNEFYGVYLDEKQSFSFSRQSSEKPIEFELNRGTRIIVDKSAIKDTINVGQEYMANGVWYNFYKQNTPLLTLALIKINENARTTV